MHPSCRSASDNLYVPVEHTSLLHKEVPVLVRHSPERFRLGLGETTRNLRAGECGICS
jgi:hypothetical protein